MDVFFVTDPVFHEHDTGAWHPERPARLDAAERGVITSGLSVRRERALEVDRELLTATHDPVYVAAIEELCRQGGGEIDADTVASARSWDAAIRAAGAGPQAVEHLATATRETVAFLAVRPPGHHATRNKAMGFCLFNNVVVAARRLQADGQRVAIIDWDVHHGNGTQDMVDADSDILYVSVHQSPFYPMTGHLDEMGRGKGIGTIVNAPVPAGTGGDVYRDFFDRVVVPVVKQFGADWILVSAGFDAHAADPLAEIRLGAHDYRFMASSLRSLVPENRTIVFLEGGYDLAAITASVASTLQGFAGQSPAPVEHPSGDRSWAALERAVVSARRHWSVG